MKIQNILFRRKSLVFIITSLIIIILHWLGVVRPIENLLIKAASPLQRIAYGSVATINRLEFFKKFNFDLLAKNQELENNYKKLLSENLSLKKQIDELKTATNQIDYYEKKNYTFELASIIGKDTLSDSTYFILDRGSRQGIKIGQPIMAEEGMIIGKIIEVQDEISKAIILLDSNSKTAATFKGKERTLGIINGDHGLGMKMELIPQDENIANNDIVITSGTEEYIPYGFIIGSVTKVNKEANNFFQTAFVQPLISYNTIRIVTILKTY